MSVAQWVSGASFEQEHLHFFPDNVVEFIYAAIARLESDVAIDHRLGLFIPVIEEIWSGCRYLWMRRARKESVESMTRWGWYRPHSGTGRTDLWVLTRPRPPVDTWSERRKCEWYYDAVTARIMQDLLEVPAERKLEVWLQDLDSRRAEIAHWIGRPELAAVHVPRVHRAAA